MRPAINGLMEYFTIGVEHWIGRKAMLASWEEITDADMNDDWFDFLKRKEQILVGTPAEVTETLQRYEQEAGADHLVQFWAMPGITIEQMFCESAALRRRGDAELQRVGLDADHRRFRCLLRTPPPCWIGEPWCLPRFEPSPANWSGQTTRRTKPPRQVYNQRIDMRPSLLARPRTNADVITALRWAREHDLEIAVRSSGHNYNGFGASDGGVVIDLGLMRSVRVDPLSATGRIGGGTPGGDLVARGRAVRTRPIDGHARSHRRRPDAGGRLRPPAQPGRVGRRQHRRCRPGDGRRQARARLDGGASRSALGAAEPARTSVSSLHSTSSCIRCRADRDRLHDLGRGTTSRVATGNLRALGAGV